jgi:hypothetical protein
VQRAVAGTRVGKLISSSDRLYNKVYEMLDGDEVYNLYCSPYIGSKVEMQELCESYRQIVNKYKFLLENLKRKYY